MSAEKVVEIAGLRVTRGGRAVLDLASWSIDAGGHAVLLGPSGSGKTTLLHCIGGLLSPDTGSVRVGGRDLSGLSGAALDRFRGATIGIVFQTLRLVRALTVGQNLELALHLAGRKPDPRRIADTLARLGVEHLAGARPNRLSVGEQQRAAIARAVVAAPRLILADEPTSALDDDNAAAAIGLLQTEARAAGAALIVATHDRRIAGAFSQTTQLAAGRA
jgi:putative ABC transport system ATP-binding protein